MNRYHGLRWALAVLITVALGLGNAWAKGPPEGKGPGSGGGRGKKVDHKAPQPLPIQLGVSGAPLNATANGYCCGGTLGALVEAGGVQYILGNWHVLSGDAVPGDNGLVSEPGDLITQPANIDLGCLPTVDDAVATLSAWVYVLDPSTNADAAIAQVIEDDGVSRVDTTGSILEIGPVSSTTLTASLDLPVKKSGRSGLSEGKVVAVDAEVIVSYEDECAGEFLIEKAFTGQTLVRPGKFIKPGDSGSLMVEDVDEDPRPVGLLYAGSKFVGVANPIDDVLAELGAELGQPVTMVGAPAAAAPSPAGTQMAGASARASRAKARHAGRLLQVPGAVGHAVGAASGQPGRVVIKLLVEQITPAAQSAYPRQIDGIPVELMEVGKIVAY